MSARWRSVAVVATMAVGASSGAIDAVAQVLPATPAQDATGPLRVLAAGDSFAAGEGLPNIQTGETACQRALGDDSPEQPPSKAWPVLVKEAFEADTSEAHWEVDPFWFVACTGNVSPQFSHAGTQRGGQSQVAEAEAGAGDLPWDVITFSFGGNDVEFGKIIRDCIGFDGDVLHANKIQLIMALLNGMYSGCSMSEQDMKGRIADTLPGALRTLYADVEAQSRPGTLVVVAGYPQLVADPSVWPLKDRLVNRCNRLSEGDARSIRGATGYLNQTIGQAVEQAKTEHPDQRWVFVDVNTTFEANGRSHGLCGPDEWINGFSFGGITDGDLRGMDQDALLEWVTATFNRSYHPTQAGQTGHADAVETAIRRSGWTPTVSRKPVAPNIHEIDLDAVVLELACPAGDGIRISVSGGPADGADAAFDTFKVAGYGDVTGDGKEEAILAVVCALASGGNATVANVVAIESTPDGPRQLGASIDGSFPRLEGRDMVVTRFSYEPDDPNCCPSISFEARFKWDGSIWLPA